LILKQQWMSQCLHLGHSLVGVVQEIQYPEKKEEDMGLLDDLTKGSLSTVLLGIGVAMVVPGVLPGLTNGLRPLAKSLVKGGVTLYDAAKEGVAEAGEQLSDLVAESRAELAQEERGNGHMQTGGRSAHETKSDTTARTTRKRRAHA
jgi:Protein of unknown function (DUF5132)